ncbi:hypothetical protein [Hyunsoonleella aestuarii]|uniref:Uncharacterized protein n=1 Tax=Hyunsoonleella aestuarii TaxID=912802 RepID=A0ABP8EAY7_9FLAO|nr:hypothetical protein [Hyunsoonleella aestuarii]
MKYYNILAVLFLSSVISFYSCNDSSKSKTKSTIEQTETENTVSTPNAAAQNNTSTQTTQSATGQVFHYTCVKGCSGGADSAINCTTCGTLLVHNAAFHNKPNSTPPAGPFLTPQTNSSSNAAGVFHYTCSNGCAGGSGSAGNCSTCGNALAHNAAYHQ